MKSEKRRILMVVVVCDDYGETAVYLNGVHQERFNTNDAYDVARVTNGKPCRVVTRSAVGCPSCGGWPLRLSDITLEDFDGEAY